jgi:hypothetical protein
MRVTGIQSKMAKKELKGKAILGQNISNLFYSEQNPVCSCMQQERINIPNLFI